MKTIKILLFVAIGFISIQLFSQRNVIWVHGLNDDSTRWEYYDALLQQEYNELTSTSCHRRSYNTDNGIPPAARALINSVIAYYGYNGATQHRNLGIGHSMGGLMIRDADRIRHGYPKIFGGYITVTTPNYGAPIANSVLDGAVEDAAEDACNKIIDGPLSQMFRLPWNIVNNISTDFLCDILIGDRFILKLTQTTNETLRSLAVDSSDINNINDYTDNVNPSIPRIAIWAEENSPVHWRLVSTEKYGNDIRFVRIMRNIRGVYNAYYIMNLSLGAAFNITGLFDPGNYITGALFYYRASQWKKGRDWFDDSENIWNALIRTTKREPHEFWELVFVPDPDYDDCMEHYENEEYPWPGDCGHWEWQWVTRMVSVNYPSDGLLPEYTQVLQNIPPDNIYKVEGANHLEVTDMSNSPQGDITANRFREIFRRRDWFHTD